MACNLQFPCTWTGRMTDPEIKVGTYLKIMQGNLFSA